MKRLFVMDVVWKDHEREPRVFIDPLITATSQDMAEFTEGCLSIPDTPCRLSRPARITMRWQDLYGARHEDTFEGITAVVVQHEFDHLDGVLIIDRPALPIPAPDDVPAQGQTHDAATQESA